MMFDNINVGDEVSLIHTDTGRTFFDMFRYVGRVKVEAVKPGTIKAAGRTFLRKNGTALMRCQWSIRPVDDVWDAESLRRQATRSAELKAKAEGRTP